MIVPYLNKSSLFLEMGTKRTKGFSGSTTLVFAEFRDGDNVYLFVVTKVCGLKSVYFQRILSFSLSVQN